MDAKMWNETESDYRETSNIDFNHTTISDVLQCSVLERFGLMYKRVHGYTSISVCVFGAIANILNLVILTRKDLTTPTNLILTGLAFADMLNMVEYIPYVFYLRFHPDPVDGTLRKTYTWALFVLFHANFSQVCHTIAIWLTLTLAIWRYIMVTRPLMCKSLCSMKRAKLAVILAYTLSPFLCTSIFFTFSVKEIPSTRETKLKGFDYSEKQVNRSTFHNTTLNPVEATNQLDVTKYIVNMSDYALAHPVLKRINFWFFSVVIKIIPCIILTIVSYCLIKSILAAQRRKEEILRLHPQNKVPLQDLQDSASRNRLESGSDAGCCTRSSAEMCATTRTTRMLVAVLLLFLITEFPQGILALLSDIVGGNFFESCYMSLSNFMDFLALLNSAINFILYCTMSQKFRNVFCHVFQIDKIFARR